jgi:hypothetical protein
MELSRGKFTTSVQATFPAGGLAASDQKSVITWALSQYPFSMRIGGYIDIGATDPTRDMDDFTKIAPLYADEAIKDGGESQLAGINPIKAILLRCLVGSGLLYVNVLPEGAPTPPPPPISERVKQSVFPLHAGVGLFYYTFPRRDPWRCVFSSDDGSIPPVTTKTTIPSCVIDLGLRTFEDSNRFQLEIFR